MSKLDYGMDSIQNLLHHVSPFQFCLWPNYTSFLQFQWEIQTPFISWDQEINFQQKCFMQNTSAPEKKKKT